MEISLSVVINKSLCSLMSTNVKSRKSPQNVLRKVLQGDVKVSWSTTLVTDQADGLSVGDGSIKEPDELQRVLALK